MRSVSRTSAAPYAFGKYRLRESAGLSEHVRSGLGTVVPAGQGSTNADVGGEAEAPRRRQCEAERCRIVAESYRSGELASAVVWRHGVHSVLFRWRRRYRTAADTGTGFVPVVVEAPEPSSEAG